MNSLPDIRNLSLEELTAYCAANSIPSFRAQQIFQWIYRQEAWGFEAMTNIPHKLRDDFSRAFSLKRNGIAQKMTAQDGTTKFLFDLEDHEKIESVFIPTPTRVTGCISTQAGCKFGCKFCASGIGGWKRHLSVAEIVTQVLHIKQEAIDTHRSLSHIVFMGTGEPLDNFTHLMKAIRIINAPHGMNIGARHITISTVGVVPRIKELSQEGLQIELAISLHGYDNPSRDVLMPVNKKYPFDTLIAACRDYVRQTNRQITFEYILIKNLTCTPQAIVHLKKAFRGLICKMNLIPYNPVSEFDHQTPSVQEMHNFKNSLEHSGIHATLRTPRGKDVNAACGQLRHLNTV